MDQSVFTQMAEVEGAHWWFRARRKIVDTVLSTYVDTKLPDPKKKIIDIGCGTGGNLPAFSKHGSMYAMEYDRGAIERAKKYTDGPVKYGSLPHEIPFGKTQFSCAILTDVLEHIKEDSESLKEIYARLSKNGRVVITVPANPSLWSEHDEIHHHMRRYTHQELRQKLERAGFVVEYISYYNMFLFPIVKLVRLFEKRKKIENAKEVLTVPNPIVNSVLYAIFSAERWLLTKRTLPFGVSLIAVAKKEV